MWSWTCWIKACICLIAHESLNARNETRKWWKWSKLSMSFPPLPSPKFPRNVLIDSRLHQVTSPWNPFLWLNFEPLQGERAPGEFNAHSCPTRTRPKDKRYAQRGDKTQWNVPSSPSSALFKTSDWRIAIVSHFTKNSTRLPGLSHYDGSRPKHFLILIIFFYRRPFYVIICSRRRQRHGSYTGEQPFYNPAFII